MKNAPRTDDTKAKISAALKGRKRTPEHQAAITASLKGRKLSEEHRAKIGASQAGRSSGMAGKSHSPEGRERISAGLRNHYQRPTSRDCLICGMEFPLTSRGQVKAKFTCSLTCRGMLKHQRAVGNTIRTSEGYVRVMVPKGTPGADKSGRMLEHRWVLQQALGRPLLPGETTHHLNGDKTDNRLENLQVRQGRHGKGVELVCRDCGSRHIEALPLG